MACVNKGSLRGSHFRSCIVKAAGTEGMGLVAAGVMGAASFFWESVIRVQRSTTLGRKFNIFLARTQTKNVVQNSPKCTILIVKF